MLTLENQFKVKTCSIAIERMNDFFDLDRLMRQSIDLQWMHLRFCEADGILAPEKHRQIAELLLDLQADLNAAQTLPKLKQVSIAVFVKLIEIEQDVLDGIKNYLLGDLHCQNAAVPHNQAVDEWLLDEPRPEESWSDIYGEMS